MTIVALTIAIFFVVVLAALLAIHLRNKDAHISQMQEAMNRSVNEVYRSHTSEMAKYSKDARQQLLEAQQHMRLDNFMDNPQYYAMRQQMEQMQKQMVDMHQLSAPAPIILNITEVRSGTSPPESLPSKPKLRPPEPEPEPYNPEEGIQPPRILDI